MAKSPFLKIPDLTEKQVRRIVITGVGIISPIGNNEAEVVNSLKTGKSGIIFDKAREDFGLRCQVFGKADFDMKERFNRKTLRFMGRLAALAQASAEDCITDSGLTAEEYQNNPRVSAIYGQGSSSYDQYLEFYKTATEKGMKRVIPYYVSRIMTSSAIASVATNLKVFGPSYSIASACATGAHAIGHGCELIAANRADMVLAGGSEEASVGVAGLFDAMMALSSGSNDNPTKASRPFDIGRDGFVPGEGGGCVMIEEYEHAKARGAKIYAEIRGYGSTSDGFDPVAPSGDGARRCMLQAIDCLEPGEKVDYINAHGTSTPVGDAIELQAVTNVFGENSPMVSSTKALTGHCLGGAGAVEAIYTALMIKNNFITPCYNLENREPGFDHINLPSSVIEKDVGLCLSNSFGFGGANASLLMGPVRD